MLTPRPGRSKYSPLAMPRFPNYTAAAAAVNHLSPVDDEDNDICPVCDGDCTCNNRPRPPPLSMSHGNARFVATPTPSTGSSASAPELQPLKIKLTVPPSTHNKTRSLVSPPKESRAQAPSGVTGVSLASSHLNSVSSAAGHGQHSSLDARRPKRRGCASKPVAIAPYSQISGNEATTLPQSQSRLFSHTHPQRHIVSQSSRPQSRNPKLNLTASRQTPKSQAKSTIVKESTASKKKQDYLSDHTNFDVQPSDGPSSRHFPTFVSADELTSEVSDSSESDTDTSGFGSDSSLAAEEEDYIVAEQRRHDKARIRRELLGDDAPKHKDSNNSWVIRPRKKSVGLSDVDMDGDTDDTTEEDEDEVEEMEEDDEEGETDDRTSRVYTGLATGWSDDEESSFDADLFFANLTDTSSDDGASETDDSHLHDSAIGVLTGGVSSLRSVDFEVTEAWDGQVVFTNGENDGHGVLDLAFEANAAQLHASDSNSISYDSDVEMRNSDGVENDFDDGDSEFGASDGDTTEEELVDEQGLPTSCAMKLLRWPPSVSSINPMSTVSPNVSPAPVSRRHSLTALESPRPGDILAGRVFWEETNQTQLNGAEGSVRETPSPIVRAGMPIMGEFSLGSTVPQNTAILNGLNRDVPSPYAHLRRRFSSSAGSFSSVELRGRTTRLSIYPCLPPLSNEPTTETAPDLALDEPINLDDVLDSTFLDSELETHVQSIPDSEGEQRLVQNSRGWDHVPVGAFRLTRESATSTSDVPTSPGWTSEPAKSSVLEERSYRNALKISPLHTMLWHDRSLVEQNLRKSREVITSPVLLPIRDGDRTPPHVLNRYDLHSSHRQHHQHHHQHQQQQHTPFKTRKESRREMKMMKRKTQAPAYQHYDQHQRHYRRNHHPNMKSRGNASVQRAFFGSPSSAPALNI